MTYKLDLHWIACLIVKFSKRNTLMLFQFHCNRKPKTKLKIASTGFLQGVPIQNYIESTSPNFLIVMV